MVYWNSLTGMYLVEITSASVSDTLTAINAAGILLNDVCYMDELTVQCTIRRSDYLFLKKLTDRRGEVVKIIKKEGLFWRILALKRRPVLLIGFTLIFVLVLYLPTRVLFVRVEGNVTVPTKLIMERARTCGIDFGASRRMVRSEKMKNALLSAVPELQWAGVNTYGCVAVISVREKTTIKQEDKGQHIASIIAKKDGIISKMTVTKGNPLCRVGQAVTEGQVLISAYTDCGLTVKAEAADAEVFALTRNNLEVVTPAIYKKTVQTKDVKRRYVLQIGKKLINFSKDSGISDATCVKMYKTSFLLLPGGFQLPIALITQEQISRTFESYEIVAEEGYTLVRNYTDAYLNRQMLAGKILQSDFTFEQENDTFTGIGNFSCIEMIGQARIEENFDNNGKRD